MPKTPTKLDEMIAFFSSPDAELLTPEGQRRLNEQHCLPMDEDSRSPLGVALRTRRVGAYRP